MYIIEFTQTRPNINIPYYGEILPVDFIDYFTTNYIDTGKFINKDTSLSSNELVLTITQIWNTEQDFMDYENDVWIINNFLIPSIDYRTANNITQAIVSAVTI